MSRMNKKKGYPYISHKHWRDSKKILFFKKLNLNELEIIHKHTYNLAKLKLI